MQRVQNFVLFLACGRRNARFPIIHIVFRHITNTPRCNNCHDVGGQGCPGTYDKALRSSRSFRPPLVQPTEPGRDEPS